MSKRSGIMLCYPFEERRLAKWKPPYFVQPKLDGERCRAILYPQKGVQLLSSEQNEIISVPTLTDELRLLAQKLSKPLELDGELYVHGMAFEEIHSIVGRTVNINPSQELMEYHVFDIVDEHRAQIDRIKLLLELKPLIGKNINIHLVETRPASDLDEVMRIYNHYVEDSYEGIIVRHLEAPYVRKRATTMMKFKPKKQDVYRVTGYKEEIDKYGKPKGRLGALICVGDDGAEFSVGSGLNDELRSKLWVVRELLTNYNCIVSYQHITSGSHVPRFPVFMELVKRQEEPKFDNPLM
ncbi:MAG: hypothetical protein KKF27_20590 [Gammaproteobacteria bacterium]|nr:hypothetical protein [Gammaproteobacteria bacterium]